MTEIPAAYRSAIAAVRPDLAAAPMRMHTGGWDSNAVEAGGTIFKFPKRDEAIARLRREARFLALVRPRVPLAVPDMVLYEAPLVFSEHAMIPGAIIEAAGYERVGSVQRQAMGEALAGFYAALHEIPLADALAAGAGPKPEWPAAEITLPVLRDRLPASHQNLAADMFAAYAALPPEDEVFGYFDGHGWNMAFDHDRGVLNGVYDFADAAIGPRSRDFVYSNLTSPDLTLRIIASYEQRTGRTVDRRTVAVRTAVQNLSELADSETLDAEFAAGVVRWLDHMQSQPALAI